MICRKLQILVVMKSFWTS